MEEIFFCPNCMAKTAPENGKCPVCGSNVNVENAPHQLPVNTILNGRYVTGRALREDAQSITYIAYDLRLNATASIREYYPRGTAGRRLSAVFPAGADRNAFEAGRERFIKNAGTPVNDSFKENGTAYIVTEYRHPAAQPKKSPRPALPKKCLIAIGAAVLVVLAACIAVPRAIDAAKQRELATARGEAAAHSETTVSASWIHTVGVRADGTVVAVGWNEDGECDVSDWRDIIAVSAGDGHTVGLRSDGTVVAVGENGYGKCDVSDWSDIVAVSAGSGHTVGLKSDGTVVAVGGGRGGRRDVSEWSDIVAVSAGSTCTVGLKSDGTAVAAGNEYEYMGVCNVSGWSDIKMPQESLRPIKDTPRRSPEELAAARAAVAPYQETALSTYSSHTAGLKADGTVVVTEFEGNYFLENADYSDWNDIVAVDTGLFYTAALRSDGTVLTEGYEFEGQCDISDWTDMVAIAAGYEHLIGLRADGTVAATGFTFANRCAVGDWTDIVAVSAGRIHTVGLKSDGTLVAVGENRYGQCDSVGYWKDIIAVSAGYEHTVGLKAGGTVVAAGNNSFGQCDVGSWTGIVAVSAGEDHTVALRADGTVVAVGNNDCGQCDVSGWTDIIAVSAGSYNTVGLKSDGTVVAAGSNENNRSNVTGWKDIRLPKAAGNADNDVIEAGTL